jgi:hypothetical protein
MGLSTSDLPEGGSGLSKTFSPGNQKLKINSVKLEPFRFIEGAYHLMLNCETEKIEGFEVNMHLLMVQQNLVSKYIEIKVSYYL